MSDNNKNELNLKEMKNKYLISLDIGGSLTKICIISQKNEKEINEYLFSKNIFEHFDLGSYNMF